ncbi:MAG: hypothetical protein IJ626_01305 [Muribaculaceae bacterium]|nr:hypothetical protein [Muribaculaceae bacterium]
MRHKVSLSVVGSVVSFSCEGTEHCPAFQVAVMNHLSRRRATLIASIMPPPL